MAAFTGRSLDGGVDEVTLPGGLAGRLWLCGKHVVGPDPQAALGRVNARTVVCLTEEFELAPRYPGYVDWLRQHRSEAAVWVPVPDLHAPGPDEAAALVVELVARLDAGDRLLVHCGAGMGRAGTLAAAVLIRLGLDLEAACGHVRGCRPGAGPEAGVQRELLITLAARWT